ncbi:MAG TPA: thioredoxin family protein [Actinomycetes bacterium]|nr:thioredoxin family protein [Actinomycetes bacterium]
MNGTGVVVLLVVLSLATAFALWRRSTDGRWRATASSRSDGPMSASVTFPASELGITLGERATLVQFSTAFCQPCRATRRVLGEVAEMVDGVVAAEVDAEAHLDVVRQLNVMRTPTVFVLDASGAVVQRASGQPRKADVIAAIGALEAGSSGV